MKKFVIVTLMSVVLILANASASYSQTSGSSTTDRAELISLCEKAVSEVKASRALIKSFERSLEEKRKVVETAGKLQALSDEAIKLQKEEIASLRSAIAAERVALEEKEKEVKFYKKELEKTTKKKNFFKKLAQFAMVSTAVLAIIVVSK